MRAIEAEILDAVIAFDASRFLDTLSQVIGDFAEDANFSLDDLGIAAGLHVARDIVDETLLGTLIPDPLVESSRRIEVFRADLAKEGDSITSKLAVDLIEIGAAVLKRDGLNRAQVVGPGTLVVEGHIAVALEVSDAVSAASAVDGQLLVIDTYTVTVSVGVGEESRL